MSNKFCVYCSQELEGNDKFCHKCGATVDNQKPISHNQNDGLHSKSLATPETKEKKQNSARNLKPLLLIPIILFSIALPIIIISSLGAARTPLGTLDYEVSSMEYLDVELLIDNSVGLIEITYDDSMETLFEATVEARGGIKASLEDAKNFQHEVISNKTVITFESDDALFSFWSFKSITHDLYISLNPDATIDFAIHSSVGSVSLDLDGIDDLVMNDVQISSSTGSVNFYSGNAINTTMDDIDLSTSTGRVIFDFEDAIETTVNEITFNSSTGSITALLGETMNINSADIIMSTSTGSIEINFEDVILNADTNWDIESSTGSITIEFTQNIILPINFTSTFDVETDVGSITVDGEVTTDLGIEIYADTDVGSIDLPNGLSYYASTDYHLKNNQYSFTLLTSTGSISVDIEY
ncbi:MAG: hypothetical protein ACTSQK_02845 [Candidatus Heimdallarchaeota archaeon]